MRRSPTSSAEPFSAAASPVALPRPDTASHLPQLDGVRGLAALLVFLHHGAHFQSNSVFASLLGRVTAGGWMGVDLFFVLSGFLITRQLLQNLNDPRYYRNFYGRRVLRIFPLYYGYLLLILTVLPALFPERSPSPLPPGESFYYWTFLSNVRMAIQGGFSPIFVGITWSLAVEEQFYIAWPWFVRRFRGFSLFKVCAYLVGAASLLRLTVFALGLNPILNYVLLFTRMDALAIGAAAAALVARGSETLEIRRRLLQLAPVMGVLGLGSVLMTRGELSVPNQLFGYACLAMFYGGAVLDAATNPQSRRVSLFWKNPVLRWLGKYSYGIYMLHRPIQTCLWEAWGRSDLPYFLGSQLYAQTLFYAAALVATGLVAWLSYNLFEKHFLALKHHFSTPAVR